MATTVGDKKKSLREDDIIGSHSVMLALEPRFMFDAAVAATDAEIVDQAADAFAEACGDTEGEGTDAKEEELLSAGDEGAYAMGASGFAATAASTNKLSTIEAGDGSDNFTFEVDEDSVLVFTGSNKIVIEDAENDVLIVTISVENGELNAERIPGVIYEGLGTGTVTLTGSASSITEALESMRYQGNRYYNSEDPRYGTESITLTVKDSNPALQTPDRVIEKSYDIYVKPVNNVPIVDQPDDINIEIEQNETGVIPPITIFDPDYGDEITVTLRTENGVLIFADGTTYEFEAKDIGSGKNYNTYTIRGSVDEINSILADLGYRGEDNFSGTDQILVTVTDGNSNPITTTPIDVLVTPVNQPPEIVGTPDIPSADEGGSVILGENNFNIVDPDSSDAQLVIKIIDAPEHGDIWYQQTAGDDTTWVKLGVGSTFSLQDVKDGRLRYTHDGSQVQPGLDPSSGMDGFRFSVNDSADGTIDDAYMNIELNPVNQAPSVSVEEDPDVRTDPTDGLHLVVYEGEEDAVVKFVVDDPDQNPDIPHTVTFTGLPQDGSLYIVDDNGNKIEVTLGMEVPMSWINEGRLTYTHNGADGAEVGLPMGQTRDDSFSVRVTDDGGGTEAPKTWEGELRIQVWPDNDDPEWTFPPEDVIVDNRTPQPIDNSHLSLSDPDSPNDDLTYTITKLPDEGTLYIRTWDTDLNDYVYTIVTEATYDPSTGKWSGGTHITQGMIDNASDPNTKEPVLVYHYAGEGPVEDLVDTINFVVRDGAITNWDNSIPGDDKSHEGGIGEYNPDTGRWELTEQQLNFVVNIDPTDPGPGDLIIQEPPQASITIGGDLETTVDEGGRVQLTTDDLSSKYEPTDPSIDLDLDAGNLRYRLLSLPENGQLLRDNGDGTFTVLTPGTHFYQSDIDAGLIFYQHNGSESFTDSFRFSVSDGNNDTLVDEFNFNIRPVNDTPTVRPGNPIEVDENNAVDENGNPDPYGSVENGVVLGPDDIRLYDVDGTGDRSELSDYDNPNDLSFVITSLPVNGKLYIFTGGDRSDMANWREVVLTDFADTRTADWSGLTGDIITMQDLIDGNLMYFNDGEEKISDGFKIVINDNMGVYNNPENGADSITGEIPINIAITPVNDPPRNTIDETLVVDENGSGIISKDHLTFTDPDNTSNEITYTITERPENGVLYLYKNGRWVALGVNSTFTQKDIDDGNLRYVHDGSEWHSDSFSYSVSDGVAVVPDNVFHIDVNPVNIAPEVTVNGEDTKYIDVREDKPLGGWFNIEDPDYDGDEKEVNDVMEMTITATVIQDKYYDQDSNIPPGTLFGILGFGTVDGIDIISYENGKLVVRGTREQLQQVLDQLTYRSADIDDPGTPIDLNSAVALKVEVNDMNNGGGEHAEHTTDAGLIGSATTTIFVSPIDTAPSFNEDGPIQDKPVTLDVDEDDRLKIEYNGKTIVITDKDAFDRNNNTVVLSVEDGILWIKDAKGVTISNNLSGEITLTGTLESINAALASLWYVPDANWNGETELNVHYGDSGNTGWGGPLNTDGTVLIHVHAMNDQPELTVDHDIISLDGNNTNDYQSLNIPGSDYSISDMIDMDPELNQDPDLDWDIVDQFQLTLTLTYEDMITLFGELKVPDSIAGLNVEIRDGGATLVLTGTKDAINEALKDLSVKFTEAVTEDTIFNLRFTLDDLRNGGPEGADGIVVKDMLIIANIENDAAEINGVEDITVAEDNNFNFKDNDKVISINDPDALDGSLQITLTVQHGTLNWSASFLASLGLSVDSFNFYDDAAGRHYTIVANQDTINAALEALVYTPDLDWNGSDVLDIYVNDRGNTVPGKPSNEINPLPVEQGGDGLVTTAIVNITITARNDSPIAIDDKATLPSVDEDIDPSENGGSTVEDLFGGLFSDPRDQKYDADGNPTGSESNEFIGIWVIDGLDTNGKGLWQYSENGTDWYDVTEGMYLGKDTFIRFQPSQDYNVRRGELPDLQVRLVESETYASDVSDLTTGQKYDSNDLMRDNAARFTDIVYLAHEVIPVNDAPELTYPDSSEEKPVNINEDKFLDFTGSLGISVSDVDADPSESPDYEMTITLTVENGQLHLGQYPGVSGYEGPSGTLVLTGTMEDINNALRSLRYIGNQDYYGADKLTIVINDNGDGSENQGTEKLTDTGVVYLMVRPVNDPPVIDAEGNASVLEDGSLAFTGENKIVISDVDINDGDGEHLMTVTLSGILNGQLSLGDQYSDLITGGANGTDSITLTGTLDQINEALASLVYTPNADWNGSETLTVTANDNGNFGSGGEQETTLDITITVIPVNDAPSPTENDVTMETVNEDSDPAGQTVNDLFGGIFRDDIDQVVGGSDANDFAGIVVVGNDAQADQGVWQYYDTAKSAWVTIGGDVSDSNATYLASGTLLRFLPNADFNGTPGSLTVRLVDNAPVDVNNPSLGALPINGVTGLDVSDNGGTTRYSADTVVLGIRVQAVNDAPTRNGEEVIDTGLIAYYRDDGNYPIWTVESMLEGKFNDSRDYQRDHAADGSLENDFAGIAVTDIPDSEYGYYQYWNGSSWITIDSTMVNDNTALILSKDTQMRFVPNPDIQGDPDIYAAMRLIDSSDGPVNTGETISKSVLNEDYDQTGVYSDLENQVILVITAMGKNTAPYVNDLPDDLVATERGDPIRIGEGSTVGDRELLNIPELGWQDFSITIRREGGANSEDVFTYFNGTEFVEISAGDSLYYNGVLVGVVTKNSGGELMLTFNNNADQESISSILGNVGYSIDTHQPPESITLEYVLNDGNNDDRQGKGGELEGFAYQVITILPVPEDPIAEDNIAYIQLDENRNGDADGNILWNAYDPDGTPVHVEDPDILVGEYGYLTVDSEGNWVYVVNPNHPDVQALEPGQQLIDTIVYRVGDGNDGAPATATLTIIIENNISRTILPDDNNQHDTEHERDPNESDHFHSLWSKDKRDSSMDHLRLADMSVDKPVVRAVHHANTISDWEINSALASLQHYGINPDALRLGTGILDGIELTRISVEAVPVDSFLIYRVRTDLLLEAIEGEIAGMKAVLADGSTLPYWIYFDAEDGSLIITPPSGVSGNYNVVILAEGEDGTQAAEVAVLAVAAGPEEKPEVVPSHRIESSTERDALEMDAILEDSHWDPGMVREGGPSDNLGALSLAGQIAGLGTYGIARRARTLETAAAKACKPRRETR